MFGDKLREIREKKRFTIEALSQETGLSRQAIWGLESNNSQPKMSTVLAIANVLEVDPSIFFNSIEALKQNRPEAS